MGGARGGSPLDQTRPTLSNRLASQSFWKSPQETSWPDPVGLKDMCGVSVGAQGAAQAPGLDNVVQNVFKKSLESVMGWMKAKKFTLNLDKAKVSVRSASGDLHTVFIHQDWMSAMHLGLPSKTTWNFKLVQNAAA